MLNSIEPTIPNQFDNHTMYMLLKAVLDENLQPRAQNITFDFTPLEFIEPVGVTVLSNIFEWLRSTKRVAFKFKYIDSPPIRYLDDSGFFEIFLGHKLYVNSYVRTTTVPLELVSYDKSHDWLHGRFADWLTRRLHMNRSSIASILMSLGEIFINIKDHSGQKIGCIFAQHYPNMARIKIAVSDFGVGIPETVKKRFAAASDNDAILKAVEYGFSTQSTPQNRGVGLTTLISNVVKNNQGTMAVHSGQGAVQFDLTGTDISSRSLLTPANFIQYYPGTLFSVILRTDTIEQVTEEEEFTW